MYDVITLENLRWVVASMPMPLEGRGVARHVFVGWLMPWASRADELVKAGKATYCCAIFGVVKIEIPRPLAKVVDV